MLDFGSQRREFTHSASVCRSNRRDTNMIIRICGHFYALLSRGGTTDFIMDTRGICSFSVTTGAEASRAGPRLT